MYKGKNIFESSKNKYSYESYSFINCDTINKPIVFLSHKSEDKEYVEKIGEYLMNAGINIYLDKYDSNLQCATTEGDPRKVTECIENGINSSNYILCITSQNTISSWWVPFEIGYAKNANKKIFSIIRKDVTYIPDFLKIEPIITDISQLNDFIKKIVKDFSIPLNENYIFNDYLSTGQIQYASSYHPLSKYLNII